MRDDPCLNCRLPDCDEKHPQCGLHRLVRSYANKVRSKNVDQITPAERQAHNYNHEMWMIDRKAEASEGGRVFRRGSKTYGAQGAVTHG